MVKKEELFVLIKSLSQAEKRYFKIFCGQTSHKTTNAKYLKLFEAIDTQEIYNEDQIREMFEGEKFVRQLHVMKNYLRNLILKSLRSFHAKISKDAEMKDCLRNIEILFHKELYIHCRREVNRGLKIAREFELHTALIELYSWQRKLVQATQPFEFDLFRKVINHQDEAIDDLTNINNYWRLALDTRGPDTNAQEKPALLESPEMAKSLQARVLYHNTLFRYFIFNGESEKGLQTLNELIIHLDNYPSRVKENPGLYASSINNLISFLVYNKQYEEALDWIKKARDKYQNWKLASENRTLLKQVLRTYNIELEIFRDTEWFDQAQDTILKIEAFIKNFRYKIPREYLVSFWFQLANIQFFSQDYSATLHWVNEIINSNFKGIRTDLQRHIRFLNLMTHFEQNNFFVMRYFVDNTRRYLKKAGNVEPHEKILLKFFSKIGKIPYAEFKDEFNRLNETLFPKDQDSLVSKSALDYINIERWINHNTAK